MIQAIQKLAISHIIASLSKVKHTYNSKYRGGGARAPLGGMGLWSINLGFRFLISEKYIKNLLI